jgi:hypothetical protein
VSLKKADDHAVVAWSTYIVVLSEIDFFFFLQKGLFTRTVVLCRVAGETNDKSRIEPFLSSRRFDKTQNHSMWKIAKKLPPDILAGFNLTTHSSSVAGGDTVARALRMPRRQGCGAEIVAYGSRD